eukprot:CAMPEP_0197941416 /NCGR_PEP_ID=MMETSP1439-20131203/122766_1 /TAXON_ID=66791 /ORGANISM="Gonyaulax spinifera, Strain CCMP409" /LENGTH=44 /DNA_ID= /DNA_START= /DNA_END= /DNA_ORIENTATION=
MRGWHLNRQSPFAGRVWTCGGLAMDGESARGRVRSESARFTTAG